MHQQSVQRTCSSARLTSFSPVVHHQRYPDIPLPDKSLPRRTFTRLDRTHIYDTPHNTTKEPLGKVSPDVPIPKYRPGINSPSRTIDHMTEPLYSTNASGISHFHLYFKIPGTITHYNTITHQTKLHYDNPHGKSSPVSEQVLRTNPQGYFPPGKFPRLQYFVSQIIGP